MIRIVAAVFALATSLVSGSAFAQDWTVVRVTGLAWVQSKQAAATALVAGMTLSSGSTVQTGLKARAVLVHGADRMTMAPGTIISLPSHADRGLKTTVLQQVGQIALSIEKRNAPHFSVQTPLIAAIVKGTEFTVTVSAKQAEVSVQRGLVAVIALASGDRANVGPGQKAGVSLKKGAGLQVAGVKSVPKVVAGSPQPAEVEAAVTTPPPSSVTADAEAPAKAPKDPKAAPGKDGKSGKDGKGGGSEGKGGGKGGEGGGKGGDGGGGGKGGDGGGGGGKGGGGHGGGGDGGGGKGGK